MVYYVVYISPFPLLFICCLCCFCCFRTPRKPACQRTTCPQQRVFTVDITQAQQGQICKLPSYSQATGQN
ncbi:hypothetical protein L596_021356 [Steinernema carpocapsae]|uniref:Uncharacterized protein n=1 Tax=Steinernema carpocapsae TaxID=34508 RepID=A0A4U5MIH6_STECR|nr:hypothetical protein L596_021356 [Steinernema carpocapsae]